MLRFLVLLIGFVYCDAGVASGLHAPSTLSGGLRTGSLYGSVPLGNLYGLTTGGLGLGNGGLGLGYRVLNLGDLGFGSTGSLGLAQLVPTLSSIGSLSGGQGFAPTTYGLGSLTNLNGGSVPAAIQSQRSYEVRPVALSQDPVVPQVIEVSGDDQPVQVIFRSQSSQVHVQQIHTPGAAGQVESTQSEDEPHRVLHQVLRPVIQEVREVIQPYRRVVQEIRPVVEEVHTIVAKGEGRLRSPVATASGLSGGLGAGLVSYGGSGSSLGLGGGLQVPLYKLHAKKAKAA